MEASSGGVCLICVAARAKLVTGTSLGELFSIVCWGETPMIFWATRPKRVNSASPVSSELSRCKLYPRDASVQPPASSQHLYLSGCVDVETAISVARPHCAHKATHHCCPGLNIQTLTTHRNVPLWFWNKAMSSRKDRGFCGQLAQAGSCKFILEGAGSCAIGWNEMLTRRILISSTSLFIYHLHASAPANSWVPSYVWMVVPTKTTTADSARPRKRITRPLNRRAASPHRVTLILLSLSSARTTCRLVSGILFPGMSRVAMFEIPRITPFTSTNFLGAAFSEVKSGSLDLLFSSFTSWFLEKVDDGWGCSWAGPRIQR